MDKLTLLSTEQVKDLTAEKILGLTPLSTTTYNPQERLAIIAELSSFAKCKNENYPEDNINTWIDEFSNIQMPVFEVIKRIRLAKMQTKFGVTEFATFMNVDLSDYRDFYRHEKKEITEPVLASYGYAEPLNNNFRDLQKSSYNILDELPPDSKDPYGYILIRDDRNYSVFYGKENFKIHQG